MIVYDDSRVVRMTLQVVTSPTIVILMTLVVSFMLLIVQASLMTIVIIYSTSHRPKR